MNEEEFQKQIKVRVANRAKESLEEAELAGQRRATTIIQQRNPENWEDELLQLESGQSIARDFPAPRLTARYAVACRTRINRALELHAKGFDKIAILTDLGISVVIKNGPLTSEQQTLKELQERCLAALDETS